MWLAHSAPPKCPGKGPQTYEHHIAGVRYGAGLRARRMLEFKSHSQGVENQALLDALDFASEFHDLGKLDDDIQAVLRAGRGVSPSWDHMDAGIAFAQSENQEAAAWLIRAHHSPGLSSAPEEQIGFGHGPLRGRRKRNSVTGYHDDQVARTNKCLTEYLDRHGQCCGATPRQRPGETPHGLTLRLLLSCLVDADHNDTANWDGDIVSKQPPKLDWVGIMKALDEYVNNLGGLESQKDDLRRDFYTGAANTVFSERMVTCEAGVGLGKTTSITRYLLNYAQSEQLRHLFIVAPYTNILRQTAKTLKRALGNLCNHELLCENHHCAEFPDVSSRQYSALWKAPITLTTSVQFFETLASNRPANLRKLHELPGSVIFIDETHAALPAMMWPQAWRWLKQLTEDWQCRVVFASGSMIRFWRDESIIKPSVNLPELTPESVMYRNQGLESCRLRIEKAGEAAFNCSSLCNRLVAHLDEGKAEGPVLCIMNTVQSAAGVARAIAQQLDHFDPLGFSDEPDLAQRRVLHLSTSLSSADRELILHEIEERNARRRSDWVLVATSCVEAGIDLDFQTGYRERCSVASLIQTSGRVNRHNQRSGAVLFDFVTIEDGILSQHPAFKESAPIVEKMWNKIIAPNAVPAELVTLAMRLELQKTGGLAETIAKHETAHDYPAVADAFRIIQSDTRTVIVHPCVAKRVKAGGSISNRHIMRHSVQLWSNQIDVLGMAPIHPNSDLYTWNAPYDPSLLGVMKGILPLIDAKQGKALIVSNIS